MMDDLKAAHRYNAALAGCSRGKDVPRPDDKDRARWRKQALDWLRADLAAWTKQLEGGKPDDRKQVLEVLRHWRDDPDLTGLHEPDAVAKPAADAPAACGQLWADVATRLAKAESRKRPRLRPAGADAK
jgi:hypothetical protein